MELLTIDEKIERAGTPIWANIYCVAMAYKDTIPASTIKNIGIYSVGDPVHDNQVYNSLIEVYRTIDQMVESFNVNIPMRFINNQDVIKILAIIRGYMLAWKEYKDTFGLDDNIPIQDLMKIDKFAIELAKNVFVPLKNQTLTTPISPGIGSLLRNGFSGRAAERPSPEVCYYTSFRPIFLPDTPLLTQREKQAQKPFRRPSWT